MPRYTLEHAGMVKRVLLDGKDVTLRCTEADTDEGWVTVYPIDPRELSFDELKRGTDVVYGNVEVELYEGAEVHMLREGEIIVVDEYKPINWRDLSVIHMQGVDIMPGSVVVETWEGDRIALERGGKTRDIPVASAEFQDDAYPYDVYFWQGELGEVELAYVFYKDGKRLEPGEIWDCLKKLDATEQNI